MFLSHSSTDKPAVERIAHALREAGIEPWFDAWHLTPGGDWQSEIAAGIRASRSCALFVGAQGLGDWEQQELALALDRAAKDRHFRVFAVLLPGVAEPFDPTQLPPFVSTRTWIDFRRGYTQQRVFQRLVNAVVGIPLGAEEAPEARPQVCPYRGLQTFDEEHAEFFFGREADVQRLLERLKERRFLSVLGPSGSGKSSLVRAGLVPALRRGALPGSDTWRVVVLRPGAEPLTTLAAHLLGLDPAGSMQGTVDQLAHDDRTLHLSVARALAAAREDERLVLVVDQFEEVFTLCHDEEERRGLFANLLRAALSPGGKTFVVLTMRADFYPKCASYPELAQAVSANQFLAWPMEEWAFAEAIEQPARAVGLDLEEGLTDQILADLREAPGALPLMEHTLLELWERRRGSIMTLEAYRESGGVAGSLAKRADEVYESLPEDERAIARRVLLRLTQPGEGTEDTRRRASFGELLTVSEEQDAVERVVSSLAHARLLTTGTDESTGGRAVDVSHEALIRGWPRLREWLDEDRTGLRTHRRLTEAALEWERSGRDAEALYRGVRLAQTSEWAEQNTGAMNALEAEFLSAGVDAQERARGRRQRGVRIAAGSLVTGLVVVGALALLMVVQKGRADQQRALADSRELAATALEQLERDPQLALLLAIKAYEYEPTAEAEAALRRALVNSHLRSVLPVGGPEATIDVSPNGRWIATGTAFGEVALWDRESGAQVSVLAPGSDPDAEKGGPGEGPKGPTFASFSPDGKRLFANHGEADGAVWSVPDGRLIRRLPEAGGFFPGGWTPDARAVLTASNHVARLWDTTSGKVLAAFRIQGEAGDLFNPSFDFAVLSPDGRFVALQESEATVHIRRVSTGRTVATLDGHLLPGRGFSRDGTRLVLDDFRRRMLSVYDVPSGALVGEIRTLRGVYDVTLSPDGRRLIGAGEGDTARIWNVHSGELDLELPGHAGDIPAVAFSPDGRLALTASEDSTARLWDAATGRLVAVFSGHPSVVNFAEFTSDGRHVVTASEDVRVWAVPSGADVVMRGHRGPVVSARFSPDGSSVISTEVGAGTIRLWDSTSGRQKSVLRPPRAPDDLHTWADFSPNGRLAVTSGARFGQPGTDEPARLWDLATRRVRTAFPAPSTTEGTCRLQEPCPMPGAALSPDGRRLATVSEGGIVRVWDAADGTVLETIDSGEHGEGIAWTPTPNGERIVVLVETKLKVYDATTFAEISEFGPGKRTGLFIPVSPEVSADGRFVAVGYGDRTARVWDIETGDLVAELQHAGPVSRVAFSPDGRFLAATGGPPTIWDLESERPLVQLFGHAGGVGPVDFSNDASIVTGGIDRTVRIWRCEVCAPTADLLELARARVLRDLTEAERVQYLCHGHLPCVAAA